MRILTSKQKTWDLIFLCLINIFAIVVTLVFKTNFLTSTILFLGFPSFYLLYREKSYFEKIFFASVSSGILFGFVFDFIAELNKAWDWNGGLYFGKILGVVQIDVMIWFFLWVFHIFLFYEHFIDRKKLRSNFSKIAPKAFFANALSIILLLTIFKFDPSILYFHKAYLLMCLVLLIPFLIILARKPKLVFHTVPIVIYFIFVYLAHEVTALNLGQWRFPGDYIGWVHVLGVTFPIEELVFWIILSSLMGAVFYEEEYDNRKN